MAILKAQVEGLSGEPVTLFSEPVHMDKDTVLWLMVTPDWAGIYDSKDGAPNNRLASLPVPKGGRS